MSDERPSDWDWVKYRHECQASIMFGMLKALAKQNVETRNSQLGEKQFAFYDNGAKFTVCWIPEEKRNACIYFELTKSETIAIFEGTKTISSAEYKVGLDDLGNCKFRRNGTLLDSWQVLKVALEPFLFR